MPQSRIPTQRAAIASMTVDIPTASAPRIAQHPHLGRGLEGRAEEPDVDALLELDIDTARRQRAAVAAARGSHASVRSVKRGPSASSFGPSSGVRPVRLMWSVIAIRVPAPNAGFTPPDGVREDERPGAEPVHEQRGLGHLGGREALVHVEAPLKAGDRQPAQGAEDADGRGDREPTARASRASPRTAVRPASAISSASAPRPEPRTSPSAGASEVSRRTRASSASRREANPAGPSAIFPPGQTKRPKRPSRSKPALM